MVDELKEIIQMFSSVPQTAVYILIGFGVFKLVIYLSTTGIIYKLGGLLINRLFTSIDGAKQKPKEPQEVNMENIFISHEGTYHLFKSFLGGFIERTSQGSGNKYGYLHRKHVDWIIKAVEEKMEKDGFQ